jgi:DNA methyltransferase 1-associated protein 1
VVESTGIKFPDNKISGVTLRSYKMKLPPSVGLKKMKAIEQLLEELQVENKPLATEAICDQFNDLRSDIVLLYELQQALNNCEFELQTIRHKYEPVLSTKNIDMSLFETSLPQTSLNTLVSSIAATNTPQKRISEMFDTGTPSSSLVSFLNLIFLKLSFFSEKRRKSFFNNFQKIYVVLIIIFELFFKFFDLF